MTTGDNLRMMSNVQARFHRLGFVLGTVGIAVTASRIAADTREVGSWLLLLAAVLLIAGSDVSQELNATARRLAQDSGRTFPEALDALVDSEAPGWLPYALAGAVLLGAGAVAAYAFSL